MSGTCIARLRREAVPPDPRVLIPRTLIFRAALRSLHITNPHSGHSYPQGNGLSVTTRGAVC